MNEPIKIIWKYKNISRRYQYNIYIFIGNQGSDILKILNKIKDLDFYNSLVNINFNELKLLENKYGSKWYKYFFNVYHISFSINNIRENKSQYNELEQKFGKEWIIKNIDKYEYREKKIFYNYQSLIKSELEKQELKKKKREIEASEIDLDEDKIDYKILKNDLSDTFEKKISPKIRGLSRSQSNNIEVNNDKKNINLIGGNEDINPFEITKDEQEELENIDEMVNIELEEYKNEEEELEMAEIEDLFKEVDVNPDDNIKKTSDLIKTALDDDKIFKKSYNKMIEFDISKDKNIYDENLRDCFNKNYVTEFYIFKDDTIKTIKNKICCSLKNNKIFEEDSFIIPSRQYLWSEYFFDNKLEKIMIGQKWIRRNQLLPIDIEPNNNIYIYEELKGNLKTLGDNLKRFGSKIRREEDESVILYEYNDYITNNEIYLLDIYNELGKDYKPTNEVIQNLQSMYLKIYYPKIKFDEVQNIIDYLNGNIKNESLKNKNVYETIINDLLLETEIMDIVENTKRELKNKTVFVHSYVTQSVIHLRLRQIEGEKVDLYRIFNEFLPNSEYPFIQYQTRDGNIVFKFKEDEIRNYVKEEVSRDIISKWFENVPFGISFKIKTKDKIGEKFMAINLSESGRIEYKIQWKEDEKATIDDIKNTYIYIKNLIEIINKDKNRVKFDIPNDDEFKYAFINTIQKFVLPDKKPINHNDLSDFSRFFFPYISVVIDPKKRESKIKTDDEKSKFGTYLKYKRVNKYEDVQKIEMRIVYLLRNYEVNESILIDEISKQFNLTIERAKEEIEKVNLRYPYLKKIRKNLKKLELMPRYKPPGINIDIQGKQIENYKVRISGAKDKEQLNNILSFMNILLYLYGETYILKKPERQELKDKLKKLTFIAKRRNKVDDYVDYQKEEKDIKKMAKKDKQRLGFKPEKGQNQWSRDCQNSGDMNRQPQQYDNKDLDDMLKRGYSLNKKTGEYQRRYIIKGKNKKNSHDIILKSIKMNKLDEDGNITGDEIYYTCNPEENGEYFYVGFLTKSKNPFGHCMPCCYKKNPFESVNQEKREFQYNCLKQSQSKVEVKEVTKRIGDKLYILQDTNKLQEGRFCYLPPQLDYFFNTLLKKDKKVKQNYLIKSIKGYFFKYGSKQDGNNFIHAISSIVDLSIDSIINNIENILLNDTTDTIFNYLNMGDIRTLFNSRSKYIEFIKTNKIIPFGLLNNILSVPNVLYNHGCSIIVFEKVSNIIKKTLEKDILKDDFFILCPNNDDIYNIYEPKRKTIFIVKDDDNFYPIVMVKKEDEEEKELKLIRDFNYENNNDNIVKHVIPFYEHNCFSNLLDDIIYNKSLSTATITRHIINNLSKQEYKIRFQYVDNRYKCKYLITNNNLIIPVRLSGSLFDVQIVKTYDKYLMKYNDYISNINTLNDLTNNKLSLKVIGIYYDDINNNIIKLSGIMLQTKDIVPIIPENVPIDDIKKYNLLYEKMPLSDLIDKELQKGSDNQFFDKRIEDVNKANYEEESYQKFRFEFSEFINKNYNSDIKEKIIKIINNDKLNRKEKLFKLNLILYKIVDYELYKTYKNIFDDQLNLKGGSLKNKEYNQNIINKNDFDNLKDYNDKKDKQNNENENKNENKKNKENENNENKEDKETKKKLIHLISKMPDFRDYKKPNERESCNIHKTKDECIINKHCGWYQDYCYQTLTKELIIKFINKISGELILNNYKSYELLKQNGYFVSEIIDIGKFKEKEGYKIIKSTNNLFKTALENIFGKENIPNIGKKVKHTEINYNELNNKYYMKNMKKYYSQLIIPNNITLFRAYSNGFYWLKNKLYDIENRNLGYYNPIQTDTSTYFRSQVINWINDDTNNDEINKYLIKYMDPKKNLRENINIYITKLMNNISNFSNGVIEYFILNKIQNIPILILNEDLNIIYFFNNGIIYDFNNNKNINLDDKNKKIIDDKKNIIVIKYNFITSNKKPDDVEILYYL